MKKVLHITNYYYPHVGGIETATRDIVNVLKSTNKYEQQIICFGDGPNFIDEISVTRIRYSLKFRSQAISFKYKKILKKLINNFNPDAIVIHVPNPLVEHYFNCCKYKGKIIVYHHLDIMRQKFLRHFVRPIQNKLKTRADVILCHSQLYVDNSEELKKFKDKCKIIPLCYKENDFVLSPNIDREIANIRKRFSGKTLLFFSGRHTKTKGISYAIKTVKNLSGVVLFVGRVGEAKRSIDFMIDRGGPNVIYLGQVDRQQYVTYLNACDFFIFPSISKNEAFPITLIEAISLGKSPVTFTIPGSGVNYISLNGVTGIECPNKDINAMKNAITKLRDDVSLREKYKINGINRARELFNFKTFNNSFVNLFEDLLK